MKITVLDAKTLGADLSLAPLMALGEVEVHAQTEPAEVAARLADTDIAILNKIKVTREVLAGNCRLRLICVSATGYDNIDLAACREAGVGVCNVVGYSTDSVAEVTLAMALSLITHLPAYARSVADGTYTSEGVANRLTPVYREMRGLTWGIVGYGNIGRRVADVARALGCRVIAYSRTPKDGVACVGLHELCGTADIISVHLPLSDATRALIGAKEIALMRKETVFINVARGAVVDEAALAAAVREGRIGGIGVDVFSTEPLPVTHPLYTVRGMENVCLTPHMAWAAKEARERCLAEMAENIKDFLAGGTRGRVD